MTGSVSPAGLHASLAEAAEPARLAAAWAAVLASDLEDGTLGSGVSRFAENTDQALIEIAGQLLSGDYKPGWLTPVGIPRPDGRERVLHVPTVRDRIVERSVLAVITPVIDPWLGPFSYAYRPGLGVADAVQAVALLRDEGLDWAARADFHDCFGNIPLSRLRRILRVLIDDAALLELLNTFLARRAMPHAEHRRELSGLPQGSLCSAEHKPPYEQCRIMRSAGG
jgi:retron-type reverse transcriptase